MPVSRILALIAALALPLGSAQALTWNETINGDLSDSGAAPTLVGTLSSGSNLFSGTMGTPGGSVPLDADVWNFTIAAGYYLTGINLVGFTTTAPYTVPSSDPSYDPTALSSDLSFMAITNTGTIDMSDPSNHLSNALWTGHTDSFGGVYTDLLGLLDAGPDFGGIGFNGPLPAGNYTFWIQEGTAQIGYQIDFVTSPVPVPEPGSALLLGVAGLWVLRRRRR